MHVYRFCDTGRLRVPSIHKRSNDDSEAHPRPHDPARGGFRRGNDHSGCKCSQNGPTWSAWTQRSEPIFTGQYIASDPSVIHEGDIYRMSYTCFVLDTLVEFNPDDVRASICEATSPDGFIWTEAPTDGPIKGLVVEDRDGEWDENLEGSELIATGDGYLLDFSGYRQEGNPLPGFPAALELAKSSNGIDLSRVGSGPVLAPTEGWYDNDAIYSPSIIRVENHCPMIYAGHCYTRCGNGQGVRLLAATSDDGISWSKNSEPVLQAIPELS